MLEFNGKKYRSLEEQVQFLTDALATGKLIDELGIFVLGVYPTIEAAKAEIPGPYTYGDAFEIGSSKPYNLYIFTRNVEDFIDFGPFPAPGPAGKDGAQGPQGLKGDTGERGERGPQGVQGVTGQRGPQGLTGPQGIQGIQGPKGDTGPAFNVQATLTSTAQLPTPTQELKNIGAAYVIPDSSGIKHIWVIQGTTSLSWTDIGVSGVQGPKGDTGPAGKGVNTIKYFNLGASSAANATYDDVDGFNFSDEYGCYIEFNDGTQLNCKGGMTLPIQASNGISMDIDEDTSRLDIHLDNTPGVNITRYNAGFAAKENESSSNGIFYAYDSIRKNRNGTIYTYTFPNVSGTFLLTNRVKTLFGNQSIVGSGNIDLYMHRIKATAINSLDSSYFLLVIISSNNLTVDSLTDLKTLLGNTFEYPVSGVYAGNVTPFIRMTESNVYDTEDTSVSLSEFTFEDYVTTV